MAFDLKAATQAAMTEAQRAPFEFDWGDEHFSIPPMATWPLEIAAGFAELGAVDVEDVDPIKVVHMLQLIVGETDWPRFSQLIPLEGMLILVGEMTKQQMGGSMPDLSQQPEPVSTPT